MLLPVVCLLLAPLPSQSIRQVDLEFANESDVWSSAEFSPAGDVAYLGHLSPGAFTQYELPGSTPEGRVTGRVEYAPSGGPTAISPDGSRLFAVDSIGGGFYAIETSTMAVVGAVPGVGIGSSWVLVNAGGSRAVVVTVGTATQVEVIDLASLMLERTIPLPEGLIAYPGSLQDPLFIADDGVSLVGVTGSVDDQKLASIDIVTGVISQQIPLGPGGGAGTLPGTAFAPSGDGSTVMVGARQGFGSSVFTAWTRFSASPLQALNTFSFGALATSVGGVDLSLDGTRATATIEGVVTEFPVTGTVYDPLDPAVIRFGGPGALGFLWSASRNRLLRLEGSPGAVAAVEAFDMAGGRLGAVLGTPFTESALAAGFAGPQERWLLRSFVSNDRVQALDLGAAQGPYVCTEGVNSGLGREFDGPYLAEPLRERAWVAVTAVDSDQLAVVDARAGAVVARAATGRAPVVIAVREDEQLLIGHLDGTLLMVDPASGQESVRLALGQGIEWIEPEPTGTRAYVRLRGDDSGLTARLVLVETNPATPGVLASVSLSGNGYFQDGAWSGGAQGTVAFDFERDLAYAVCASVEIIDTIDLATQSIAASTPAPGISSAGVTLLTPDGSHLLVGSVPGRVTSFRTSGGLVEVWTEGCSTLLTSSGRLGLSADGSIVFVDSFGPHPMLPCPGLSAFDVATGAFLDAFPATDGVGGDSIGDSVLTVRGTQLELVPFRGGSFEPSLTFTPNQPVGVPPRSSRDGGFGFAPTQSFFPGLESDGLAIVDFMADRIDRACEGGVPNATGVQATLGAEGPPFAGADFVLRATGLEPGSMFGMLVVGSQLVPPMPVGNGLGQLCVGGAVGRLTSQVQFADASGAHTFRLSSSSIGTSAGTVVVQPGETWAFQDWHRDLTGSGMVTSNTSTALSISFL